MNKQASSKAIKAANHKFKKSLGQNFIQDAHIIEEIIANIDDSQADCYLEIGPGIGALTEYLLDFNKPLLAIELDKSLIPKLESRFSKRSNFKLINKDILKVESDEITKLLGVKENVVVVANIPYNITSPIIFKILDELPVVKQAYLMVQQEVAKRICSKEKNKSYGALSVYVQSMAQVKYLLDVKREHFWPQPKVDSAIIGLTKVNQLEEKDEYLEFLQNCFHLKRKTLVNSLASSLNLEKAAVTKFILDQGFKEKTRAEEISVLEYQELFKEYKKWRANEA